jgi:hypothetical protein
MPLARITHAEALDRSVKILTDLGNDAAAAAFTLMQDDLDLPNDPDEHGVYWPTALLRQHAQFPAGNARMGDLVIARPAFTPGLDVPPPFVAAKVTEIGIENEHEKRLRIKVENGDGDMIIGHPTLHGGPSRPLIFVFPNPHELSIFDRHGRLRRAAEKLNAMIVRKPCNVDYPVYCFRTKEEPHRELYLVHTAVESANLSFSHGQWENGKWEVHSGMTSIESFEDEVAAEDAYVALEDLDIDW